MIIPFILVTLMCDSGVILWGESRCWSLFRGQRVLSGNNIVGCWCYPYCLCSGFSSLTSHNKQQYCNFLYLFGKDVNVPQMWMWLEIQFQNLNICWCSFKTILEDDSDVIVVNEWYELMFDFLTLSCVTFVSINMRFFLPGPCPAASHCHTHRWYHFGHVWEAEMWYRTWLHYPLPCNICVLCS